ncbi:MAG: helix-turn-helix domain-containing protein [Hydrogenibacillus schlegelii]|uniref:Helix-turn-helix domain-containing protein n=1 Tax=Hydrogenibacillus schlegelii TaxID=1484 RepID=A0A947D3T9_HYDSH|nr:helix-turn-helix domain-containing protein [Hydrogenibacillus schlegelii]MBT9282675.1 helix-turn-helix domain-containing protein [Hydrogenibacillus schlegelii]
MTKIEFYRRLAGLSTVELAGRLGVHPSNLSHLERFHRKPWPRLRHRLAEVLGVPETELFDADGWPLSLDVEALKNVQ